MQSSFSKASDKEDNEGRDVVIRFAAPSGSWVCEILERRERDSAKSLSPIDEGDKESLQTYTPDR